MFAAAAREVRSLLFWCVLAASTIGPGTVVVCSKAGADFGLELLWALLAASFVAYTLQVNAARLCIVTGLPLGQAMRRHFGGRGRARLARLLGPTPALCALAANHSEVSRRDVPREP